MPIETIQFKGKEYPALQAKGFAAKYCHPFAEILCVGKGLDVGCNRVEWSFPGSIPIDPAIEGCKYNAFNLPMGTFDYIISSHMLEHVVDWVGCLDYWYKKIKPGGILFLYLPHYDQEYWRPWNNRKHVHIFSPEIIKDYLKDRGWEKIRSSEGADLNCSFTVIATKPHNLTSIGVYQIVNKFNNKRYIGSTTVSFAQRFLQHKSSLKRNKHHSYLLQRSYNKRGENFFSWEVLEDCDGMDEIQIQERENFYLEKYKSYEVDFGYNVKKEAIGNARESYQDLLLYDIGGNLLGEYKSSFEISRLIGVSASTIQSSYKRQAKGKYPSIQDKWIVVQKIYSDNAVLEYPYTVYEVDEEGKEINAFYKYELAGESLNISREFVRRLIKKGEVTSRGTFLVLKNRKYPEGSRTGENYKKDK